MTKNPYDEIADGKGHGAMADTIRKYAWNEGYNQALVDVENANIGVNPESYIYLETDTLLAFKKVSE